MGNNKTLIIGIILILAGIFAMADLDTSDLDALPNCTTTDSTLRRNSTHWYCSTIHHAELYHNSTNATQLTLPITTVGTAYNITNLTEGDAEGMTTDNNYTITATKAGHYLLMTDLSIESNPASEYELNICVNGAELSHCESHLETAAIGSMGANCIEELSINDVITVSLKDQTPPATDVDIHSLSLTAIEVH